MSANGSRRVVEFDIDRYVRNSRKVDLTDIDWDDIPNHPLSDGDVMCLRYMMDVLLRHRLLPQPHGFEGLRAVLIEAEPDHSAPAERPDPGRTSLHLDLTTARCVGSQGHNHVLPGLDEVVGLDPNGFPGLDESLNPVSPLIGALYPRVKTDRTRHVELAVRGHGFERHINLSPADGINGSANDLHVLLRHRPPSIPPPTYSRSPTASRACARSRYM
jgi:hypothetical protein